MNLIDTFNVEESKNMNEGYYLLQQSSLNNEVIEFIKLHKEKCLTISKDNKIV